MERKRLIAAMDLGTTKVKVVVAAVGNYGIDIVGAAHSASQGVHNGRIVRLEDAAKAVEEAIGDAVVTCGRDIRRVHVALPGGFVQGFNRDGMVPIKSEVRKDDIDQVRQVAIAMPLAPDQQLLEAVPQGYTVDSTRGVLDPSGMYASRLDGRYHVVVVVASAVRNLSRCCEQFGLTISDLSLPQLASAEAVLEEDEKELGVCVVDVGGGTSDLAIFRDGVLYHTAVLPLGGNHMTNDITQGLMTPRNEAERLKIRYGCAHACMVGADETFEVPGLGGRSPRVLPRLDLVGFLKPRVEQLMGMVEREIKRVGMQDDLAAGLVFTGGGSELPGLLEVAEDELDLPVRRGLPTGINNNHRLVNNGAYSTAVGLILRQARGTDSMLCRGAVESGRIMGMLGKSFNMAKEFFF